MNNNYRTMKGVNWSTAKYALQSPAAYRSAVEQPREASAAMDFGTLVHLAALEPERFGEVVEVPAEFTTASGAMSSGKDAKAWRAGFAADAVFATGKQLDDCRAIAANLQAHGTASNWLSGFVKTEMAIGWTQDVEISTGVVESVACKGLIDLWRPKDGLLLDLKTVGGNVPFTAASLARTIANWQYHGQLGWYAQGIAKNGGNVDRFGWLFVQSVAPFDVACILADEDMMAAGDRLATKALTAVARAKFFDSYPGAMPDVVTVSLPKWATETDSADVGAFVDF